MVISSIVASPSSIDKVKIVQAVQSLIRNTQQSAAAAARNENVKFRFRMKFKHQRGQAQKKILLSTADGPTLKPQRKNKPSPTKSVRSSRSPTSSVTSISSTSTSAASQTNKVRFQRDLHNSMERKRRVDLRINFDKLKMVVPEVSSLEKASKLTILNKAANYCHFLANSESRLAREWKQQSAKNERLRKRLVALRR